MRDNKITKKEWFESFVGLVENSNWDEARKSEALDFLKKSIEQLDTRTEKARAKRAEKRASGDAMTEEIYKVLSLDEWQSAATLVEKLDSSGFDGATRQKVIARLSALVGKGVVEKNSVKVGSKKNMVYRLADLSVETASDEDVTEVVKTAE